MQDTRILFFDIDGTLIDGKCNRLTEPTRQALCALRRRGVRLCIATGRAPMELPPFPGVAFDAFLTYNGSYCFAGERVIFSNPLDRADVQTIRRNAAALGRPLSLATRERLVSNGTDRDLEEYYAFAGAPVEVADDFDEVARNEEVYQIMMGCRRSDHAAILAGVRRARITAWWDRAVDIIPAQGGKGVAVARTLAWYGLAPEQAMAFGDGDNDREMLEAVGWGVAMQNGSPALRALADDVCGPVSEDGVAAYCRAKGLL